MNKVVISMTVFPSGLRVFLKLLAKWVVVLFCISLILMVKMSWPLTTGALATIMRGGTVEDPVLQILGSNRIMDGSSSERYQLLVSDGCHLNWFALLASHLNDKLISGELSDYSVVQINRLYTNVVKKLGRPEMCVIIINDLKILAGGREVGVMIGNPVAFPEGSSSAAELPVPAQSRPQLAAFTGFTSSQPMIHKMELPSPADGHFFLNASFSPFQSKSLRQEVSYILHDINLETNRKISQMQYDTANLLNAYERSFADVKKTVEESVLKRNEGLLTLHDNLSSSRHQSVIRNQMAENVAFAHLVAKQGQRNKATVVTFTRSHLEALSQLQQFLATYLQKVQEMMEKIEEEHWKNSRS